MAIKFGGKSADEIVSAEQQKHFQQEVARGTIKDPVPLPRNRNPEHLLSLLGDYTLWIEQFLQEAAALARKRYRLQQKLKEPSLQDSPGREDAQRRYYNWGEELNQYMNDIATMEANADRLWQAMDVPTRGKYGMDWNTDPTEPRLIGKAFTAKSHQYKWPKGYSFETVALRRIDPYLRRELDEHMGTEPVMLGKEMEW